MRWNYFERKYDCYCGNPLPIKNDIQKILNDYTK